jgi:DNA ligase (NAD+)
MQAQVSDLEQVPEIGQVISASITDYFSLPETKKLIQELKAAQLNMSQSAVKMRPSGLTGKTVVFTGQLERFSRSQAEALVRKLGGMAVSACSSKTDFLVASDGAGRKFDQAVKLGVKIIDEQEFLRLAGVLNVKKE